MIAVNDNEMSERSFLGWLQEADYYLKQTGLKDQFRLNREGEEYLVRGLEKKVRKGLKRAEDFDPYYKLDPSLADRWERLTFAEYSALQEGDQVWVLYDPLTIFEGRLKRVLPPGGSLSTFLKDIPPRPSITY